MNNNCLNSPTDGNAANNTKPGGYTTPAYNTLCGPDMPYMPTPAPARPIPAAPKPCGSSKPALANNYSPPMPVRNNPLPNVANKYAANMPPASVLNRMPQNNSLPRQKQTS